MSGKLVECPRCGHRTPANSRHWGSDYCKLKRRRMRLMERGMRPLHMGRFRLVRVAGVPYEEHYTRAFSAGEDYYTREMSPEMVRKLEGITSAYLQTIIDLDNTEMWIPKWASIILNQTSNWSPRRDRIDLLNRWALDPLGLLAAHEEITAHIEHLRKLDGTVPPTRTWVKMMQERTPT